MSQNVEIISFQGVAVWKTVPKTSNDNSSSANEICAICRSDLSDFCVECAMSQAHGVETLSVKKSAASSSTVVITTETEEKSPSSSSTTTSCNVAVGCHSFHRHCLAGWLKSHSVCPLCQTPWEQVSADLDRSALV